MQRIYNFKLRVTQNYIYSFCKILLTMYSINQSINQSKCNHSLNQSRPTSSSIFVLITLNSAISWWRIELSVGNSEIPSNAAGRVVFPESNQILTHYSLKRLFMIFNQINLIHLCYAPLIILMKDILFTWWDLVL